MPLLAKYPTSLEKSSLLSRLQKGRAESESCLNSCAVPHSHHGLTAHTPPRQQLRKSCAPCFNSCLGGIVCFAA